MLLQLGVPCGNDLGVLNAVIAMQVNDLLPLYLAVILILFIIIRLF